MALPDIFAKQETTKKKPSNKYLTQEEIGERYGSDKRYEFLEEVNDPAKARVFLQYLCLAAAEVTKSNKRMHCPRRPEPKSRDLLTHREFLFKLGEEKGQELWEYQHPHREQERAVKQEQERVRRERALQVS